MPLLRNLSACIVAILCATSLHAQTESEPSRGPDNGPRTIIPGIDTPPFPGLPFSGTDNIVWTRTGTDGATTTLYIASKVVRDGQGRLYREHHRFAPADADQSKTMYEFYILDPVAHSRTDCAVATHQCTITSYRPRYTAPLLPVGPFDNNRRYLARESLGTQTMDDLTVTGTRETTTISPGTVGNDREVVYTREFWYSPDLKTNLAVKRLDPHNGTQDIHLTIDSRSEPEPAVFAIPSGYTVKDERPAVVASAK
jgi:hypothetical protein